MGGSEEEDPEPKRFRAGVDLRLGAIRILSKRERERGNTSQTEQNRKKIKDMYA